MTSFRFADDLSTDLESAAWFARELDGDFDDSDRPDPADLAEDYFRPVRTGRSDVPVDPADFLIGVTPSADTDPDDVPF